MTRAACLRAVARVMFAIAALWVGVSIAGCTSRASVTDWPAREALFRRHCAIEIDRGRLPFAAFDACVHRLTAHRGETCTHPEAGTR